MSTVTTPRSAPQNEVVAAAKVVLVSWKAPIAFLLFSILGFVLFALFRRPTDSSHFTLATPTDFIQLPEVTLPTFGTGVVAIIVMLALTIFAAVRVKAKKRVPMWASVVFIVVFLVAFLAWAAAGDTSLKVFGLLVGTVTVSVPLIFGAMSGVLSERVGVVNIAIEGQLLAGAFSSAVIASITGNLLLGLIAAAVAGMLVSFVLAAFAIKYLVDQVIVGVVLNVLVTGLTSFLFSKVLSANSELLNHPPRFERIAIPGLSNIPLVGPMLFNQTIIVYSVYVAAAAIYFGLFHTKWGLRLRAVGEHPTAADTVGIKVNLTRFWNVSLAGAIAGFGGAYFTLGLNGSFSKEMTAGAGFIALAAVIFGRWDPIRATFAALLFGFASSLQSALSVLGSPVPSEIMLMLPYVVTIFAVAGLVGRVRGPAAAGKPYIKS